MVDVTCKAVNVPQASTDAFENSNAGNAFLHVFESAIENYRAKSPWKEFKEIVALSSYTLTYIVDDVVYKTYELYEGDAITPEPAPTKEGYTFSGWNEIPTTMPANDVVVTGTFTESTLGQCATPTILFAGKKYRFECDTPDAEFESYLTTEERFTGNELPLENRELRYTLTVYATAPGYKRSEPAKVNFIIDSSDVNRDGSIDVADIATIIDKMAGK